MKQLFFLVLMFTVCLGFIQYPYTVQGVTDEFPIGLVLNYEVTEDDASWNERYEVLRWATEVGENIVEIDITTSTSTITNRLLVDTSTWEGVNPDGTPRTDVVSPPLWQDTSSWTMGTPIFIPTLGLFYTLLRGIPYVVQAGSYFSWEAKYDWSAFGSGGSITSTTETLYFEEESGVLLEWSYEYSYLGPGNLYQITRSKMLTSSNLRAFEVLTIQERALPGILLWVLVIISLIMVCCAVWRRRSSSPRTEGDLSFVEEESDPEVPLPLESEEASSVMTAKPDDVFVGSRCMVCRHPIKAGSRYLKCPHCKGLAHKSNMLEWVKVKGRCPICRKKLRPSDL